MQEEAFSRQQQADEEESFDSGGEESDEQQQSGRWLQVHIKPPQQGWKPRMEDVKKACQDLFDPVNGLVPQASSVRSVQSAGGAFNSLRVNIDPPNSARHLSILSTYQLTRAIESAPAGSNRSMLSSAASDRGAYPSTTQPAPKISSRPPLPTPPHTTLVPTSLPTAAASSVPSQELLSRRPSSSAWRLNATRLQQVLQGGQGLPSKMLGGVNGSTPGQVTTGIVPGTSGNPFLDDRDGSCVSGSLPSTHVRGRPSTRVVGQGGATRDGHEMDSVGASTRVHVGGVANPQWKGPGQAGGVEVKTPFGTAEFDSLRAKLAALMEEHTKLDALITQQHDEQRTEEQDARENGDTTTTGAGNTAANVDNMGATFRTDQFGGSNPGQQYRAPDDVDDGESLSRDLYGVLGDEAQSQGLYSRQDSGTANPPRPLGALSAVGQKGGFARIAFRGQSDSLDIQDDLEQLRQIYASQDEEDSGSDSGDYAGFVVERKTFSGVLRADQDYQRRGLVRGGGKQSEGMRHVDGAATWDGEMEGSAGSAEYGPVARSGSGAVASNPHVRGNGSYCSRSSLGGGRGSGLVVGVGPNHVGLGGQILPVSIQDVATHVDLEQMSLERDSSTWSHLHSDSLSRPNSVEQHLSDMPVNITLTESKGIKPIRLNKAPNSASSSQRRVSGSAHDVTFDVALQQTHSGLTDGEPESETPKMFAVNADGRSLSAEVQQPSKSRLGWFSGAEEHEQPPLSTPQEQLQQSQKAEAKQPKVARRRKGRAQPVDTTPPPPVTQVAAFQEASPEMQSAFLGKTIDGQEWPGAAFSFRAVARQVQTRGNEPNILTKQAENILGQEQSVTLRPSAFSSPDIPHSPAAGLADAGPGGAATEVTPWATPETRSGSAPFGWQRPRNLGGTGLVQAEEYSGGGNVKLSTEASVGSFAHVPLPEEQFGADGGRLQLSRESSRLGDQTPPLIQQKFEDQQRQIALMQQQVQAMQLAMQQQTAPYDPQTRWQRTQLQLRQQQAAAQLAAMRQNCAQLTASMYPSYPAPPAPAGHVTLVNFSGSLAPSTPKSEALHVDPASVELADKLRRLQLYEQQVFPIARELLTLVKSPRGCELLLLKQGLQQLLAAAVKYNRRPPVVSMLLTCAVGAVEYLAEYFEDVLLSCGDVGASTLGGKDDQPSSPGQLHLLAATEGNWWDILPPNQASHILNATRGLMQDCSESAEVARTGGQLLWYTLQLLALYDKLCKLVVTLHADEAADNVASPGRSVDDITAIPRSRSIISLLFKQSILEMDEKSVRGGTETDAASHTSGPSGVLSHSTTASTILAAARHLSNDEFGVLVSNVRIVHDDILREIDILVKEGLLDFLGEQISRHINQQTVVEGPVGALLVLADLSRKLRRTVLKHPAALAVKQTFVKYHMQGQLRQYFSIGSDESPVTDEVVTSGDIVTVHEEAPLSAEENSVQVAKRGGLLTRGPFAMLLRRQARLKKVSEQKRLANRAKLLRRMKKLRAFARSVMRG